VSKFGSVRFLPEKNSQTEKKKKETRNQTGTGPNRPVAVRFRSGFLLILGFLIGFLMGFVMGF
jgi:hypothetical protein